MNLTQDEMASLAVTLERLSARTGRRVSLQRLLDGWSSTVAEVEVGYQLTGYDYVNQLTTRDLIEEVLRESPPSVKQKILDASLSSTDERFLAATRDLGRLLSMGGRESSFWWWKRAPNDLSGELARDLLLD